MSLFPSAHADDRSIEYTSMGYEQTYNASEGHCMDEDVETSRLNTDPSHDDRIANSPVMKAASSHMQNASLLSTGKASVEYYGPKINGWPAAPQKLNGFSIPLFVGDVLLISLPIAFLALGMFAWRLDGEELSNAGDMVERAMSLGPTIYPLAFAAIGSRCLRSIAIRLAEQGTTISTLEKLLGSQSLVSAIGTAFTLRSASMTSIALLLLWALSPLGGQSSLRLLHETNSTRSEMGTVYYSDPAAHLDLVEAGYWFAVVPTVLGASLAVSEDVKSRPVDLWSHPKVPRFDVVEQQALDDPDAEGEWIEVDYTSNQTYSSWIGIVIQGLPSDRRATFQARSSYMFLDCQKRYSGLYNETLDYLRSPNITTYPILLPSNSSEGAEDSIDMMTATVYGFGPGNEFNQTSSFFLRAAWNSTDSGKSKNETEPSTLYKQQPIEYLWGSYYSGDKVYYIHACQPNIATVDARVDCQAGDCKVTQVRKAPNIAEGDCIAYNARNVGCLTKGNRAVSGFLKYFATVTTQAFSRAVTNPFDDWVGGSSALYRSVPQSYLRNISQVPDKMISDRLTTLLNSYWNTGSWGTQITTAGLFGKPEYPWTGDTIDPRRYVNSTEAVISHEIPVYSASVGWILSLILITIVLLLLGIVNVVFSFMTIAPDLFYYASSMARENPYTNTPDGGTALDGAKRSRLLQKMKVQIADVSPDNEVGYVVLKSVADGEGFETGRLKKGRLYW